MEAWEREARLRGGDGSERREERRKLLTCCYLRHAESADELRVRLTVHDGPSDCVVLLQQGEARP